MNKFPSSFSFQKVTHMLAFTGHEKFENSLYYQMVIIVCLLATSISFNFV